MEIFLLVGELVLAVLLVVLFLKVRQMAAYFRVSKLENGKQLRVGFDDEVALLINRYDAGDVPDDIIMVTGNRP